VEVIDAGGPPALPVALPPIPGLLRAYDFSQSVPSAQRGLRVVKGGMYTVGTSRPGAKYDLHLIGE